jgi:hypothetical protein
MASHQEVEAERFNRRPRTDHESADQAYEDHDDE